MPSNSKSPYAASYSSAIKRGTSASQAVEAIAKRSGKSPAVIFSSLHKAQLCDRQKFNGQWIYWPSEGIKRSATNAKVSQQQVWQHLIDWCILSGQCKPEQLLKNAGSQKEFMSYCRKFWNRQYGASAASPSARKSSGRKRSSVRKSSVRKSSVRKGSSRKRTAATGYKFPRTTSRRYRRAA